MSHQAQGGGDGNPGGAGLSPGEVLFPSRQLIVFAPKPLPGSPVRACRLQAWLDQANVEPGAQVTKVALGTA